MAGLVDTSQTPENNAMLATATSRTERLEAEEVDQTSSDMFPLTASGGTDAKDLQPLELGRMKEPPNCMDDSLKGSAMSTSSLAELTFSFVSDTTTATATSSLDASLAEYSNPASTTTTSSSGTAVGRIIDAVPVSSSSSTCTRESDTFSDAETLKIESSNSSSCGAPAVATTLHAAAVVNNSNHHHSSGPVVVPMTPTMDREISQRLNEKVSRRKTSRQGRSTQRWDGSIRLVTGCVPLLMNGKVLFASSSRKPEWILPKGGWEEDETMEESAVREAFEEAGVLGVLGPKLTPVQYEPRKVKKRRLEQNGGSEIPTVPKYEGTKESEGVVAKSNEIKEMEAAAPSEHNEIDTQERNMLEKKIESKDQSDARSDSARSTPVSAYSEVKMTLFPLYVCKVLDSWPESGRFRKAVDIDVAIEMQEARPEFKAALMEVKRRGLHLAAKPQSTCEETDTILS